MLLGVYKVRIVDVNILNNVWSTSEWNEDAFDGVGEDGRIWVIVGSEVVVSVDKQYEDDAYAAKVAFRIKHIREGERYTALKAFPHPVQLLIREEIYGMMKRSEEGKSAPEMASDELPSCHCLFFTKYFLPCRHMFHHDEHNQVLNDTAWAHFASMFSECGFSVYEGWEKVPVKRVNATPEDQEKYLRKLTVGEKIERIRDIYHRLEDAKALESLEKLIRLLSNMVEMSAGMLHMESQQN
ncbi:hypothetical protein HK104_005977 [Borealophlyctis nickersoniae]|nr:hypothetical protein HK104_005977 [Borealophlyctis nickersoniae]